MINVRMQTQDTRLRPKITVIGVGGAGGNAVNNMINTALEGCEFLVCNTDAQALDSSVAPQRIQLGTNVTRGLGAGANPEIGRAAAEESIDEILAYLQGSNMVFVTAGMGGGTGTGAAPVIAKAAREHGILTVGVVTKPFHFEGAHRMRLAEAGIADMQKYVDTLIIIPNQNLFRIANEKTTFADAFKMADEVLQSGVRGVTDLMVMPGLINLDFADIRTVMAEMGKAMMGTGEAQGDRRAVEAAEAAISNPLLDDVSMKGAKGVLINITGGLDMTLFEVDEAANRIRDEVDPDANIIFGSTFDEKMSGTMRVSVVATGIEAAEMKQPRPMPLGTGMSDGGGVRRQSAPVQQGQRTVAQQGGYQPSSFGGVSANRSRSADDFDMAPSAIPASIMPTSGHTTRQMPLPSMSAAAQPVMAQPKMQQGFAATAPTPQVSATARKLVESDIEDDDVPPMHTKPLVSGAQQPRAQRYGNTFIPPRPVDPWTAQGGVELDPFVEAELSNPPRSQPQEKPVKKAPSFFERFTGQRSEETPSAPPAMPQQAHGLTVEKGGKKDAEDELDIPAFLRRQAN